MSKIATTLVKDVLDKIIDEQDYSTSEISNSTGISVRTLYDIKGVVYKKTQRKIFRKLKRLLDQTDSKEGEDAKPMRYDLISTKPLRRFDSETGNVYQFAEESSTWVNIESEPERLIKKTDLKYFKNLINALPLPVILIENAGRVVDVNNALINKLKIHREDVVKPRAKFNEFLFKELKSKPEYKNFIKGKMPDMNIDLMIKGEHYSAELFRIDDKVLTRFVIILYSCECIDVNNKAKADKNVDAFSPEI